MLTQLTVQNFAIVRFLELDFNKGMTAITGETGAGKSIAIDALGLCLGDRAEAGMVRPEANKADVCASFDIEQNRAAQQWLQEHQLEADGDCILRRVVNAEGRSKAYINGSPVPITLLRSIATTLLSIHGQHAHQQLLKTTHQRQLLDTFAAHKPLLDKTQTTFQSWKSLCQEKQARLESQAQHQARIQLLEYQVQELDEFGLAPGEFEDLEQEHKRLANSTELLNGCQQLTSLLSQDDQVNVLAMLQQASKSLIVLSDYDAKLQSSSDLIHEAIIQVEEASSELDHFADQLEFDPQRFEDLEARLSTALDLARKHQTKPELLPDHHTQLSEELAELSHQQAELGEIDTAIEQAWEKYQQQANKLNKSRQRSATQLAKRLTESIAQLSMGKARCQIQVTCDTAQPSATGWDTIEFMISTNPGQPLQPLSKVASGGELSRISLAIEVICADSHATPTLIFDEVDVGISGPTAAIVGKLLRQLGEQRQIICVTHLPQVAGLGHQQMLVSKEQKRNSTETQMTTLDQVQRIQELARLLAGDEITETTLANARELLAQD